MPALLLCGTRHTPPMSSWLSALSPGPFHPGDCPGQSQLLACSHAWGAAMPQHPFQAQGGSLLATAHILVQTPCQELPGAHLTGVLVRLLPSPSRAPRAPMGVPPPRPVARAVPRARRVTRSLRPWHLGCFPQALAHAYPLGIGVLYPVDCPALPHHAQTQLLSCSKGPQQAPVSH